MSKPRGRSIQAAAADFEAAARRSTRARYVLRLYVAGTTPQSQRAVVNLRRICEEHLQGRYELEVIDVYRDPVRAKADQVIAAPTLLKVRPAPVRQLIGDLSDLPRVLKGLGLL